MRRPSGAMMRSMIVRRWRSSLKRTVDEREFAAALDVDRFRAVDHDFADRRVAHEIFQRPEAEDFVDDLLLEFGALFGVVDLGALGEQLRGDFGDLRAEFGELLAIGVRAAGRDDVDALGDLLVNLGLEAVPCFVRLAERLRFRLAVRRETSRGRSGRADRHGSRRAQLAERSLGGNFAETLGQQLDRARVIAVGLDRHFADHGSA